MQNEIDRLMSLDPLDLSAQDIDEIIAYQRKSRQNWEAGIKPKKESSGKVSLDKVMETLIPKAPVVELKRRF